MTLVGRSVEVQIMQELLESTTPEMLAMYGRRRVGKTYLIQTVYKDHTVFECSGLQDGTLDMQLRNFWLALMRNASPEHYMLTPSNWLEAFEMLGRYQHEIRGHKKKVIFLDELPWFDTPRSGFMAALANFWNVWGMKNPKLILVLCGSAASWMISHIINNRGGLHNRVTRKIRLLPFTLKETKQYLRHRHIHLQDYDLIQLYMAIGGVPYYLNLVRPGKSVAQIIQTLFFDKQAQLKDEFDILYASLFSNYEQHVKVIKVLAAANYGLTRNQILDKSGEQSSGSFTQYLTELEASGLIMAIQPFQNKKKEVIYRLNDELSLFYLRFLFRKKTSTWLTMATQQSYKIWCGLAFETVCLKHVDLIETALGIHGIATAFSSYISVGKGQEEGVQIDMIIDRADNCINLCEMKFYNTNIDISRSYALELKRKVDLFKTYTQTRKNIFLTMITTFGVKRNANMLSVITNTIEIEALFK
jgi:predicted AAA+ superfamily ATPase